MTDEELMRVALDQATQAIAQGQSPFGACVARNGELVSVGFNTVLADTDVTAHAEMNAVRKACTLLHTVDLSGCVVYASCQPCPMCFHACQRAGITRVVYSVRLDDSRGLGFARHASPEERQQPYPTSSTMKVEGDFLRDAGLQVLASWRAAGQATTY